MIRLDHVAVVAPTLEEGLAHLRDSLGLDAPPGGAHPQMGTRNHLLRLGEDLYLEVIAVDPDLPAPTGPRWFGLGDAAAVRRDWDAGLRLKAMVARTDDLDGVLARHGDVLGAAVRVTRGERAWRFSLPADGGLPAGGAAPSVIEWGPPGPPAGAMADLGARLVSLTLEHPRPGDVARLHADLGFRDAPVVRPGATFRLVAAVDTPTGLRELH